jgi:DNA-binding Lrp family transcriptional regulator
MDKILPLLRKNARASIADLAKVSNLSEAEVAGRIEKLEHTGVILGYQAIVDPEKIAREEVTAVIEVKLTPERDGGFNKLAERIAKFPEVQGCYLMSGGYDLMVVVEGRTLHEVAGFVSEKLSTMKGVISTATHFRLRAYKENGVELKKESGPDRLAVAP